MPLFAGTPVLGGSAVLEQTTRATLAANGSDAATFTSSSASAVLDWSKFNVGAGQSLTFNGSGTTFFNLVSGAAGKSQIDGLLNGSGSVWVINPSGIAFGSGAQVNVGGLFAAAAGNLSNADALRAGTATCPAFSSFNGAVEVDGSTFTADQVALLGKRVAVDGGNFYVSDLNIGAGDRLVVDEVDGGKISVNVADFAEDPLDPNLLFSGDTYDFGNLSAVSDRGIQTKADSCVLTFADLDLTAAGDIEVNGALAVGDTATFAAGGKIAAKNMENDLNVVVANGDSVSISDVNGMNLGNVAATAGDVTVMTRMGRIKVLEGCTVESTADGGSVNLVSAAGAGQSGDIMIDGTVRANGQDGEVYVHAGYGNGSKGNIRLQGDIEAAKAVSLYSLGGAAGVYGEGTVKVPDGDLDVYSSYGNIGLWGLLNVGNADFTAAGVIQADNLGNVFSGTVSALSAGNNSNVDSVRIRSSQGIRLGDVQSFYGTVSIHTENGDVVVGKDAEVSGRGVSLAAADADGATGNVVIDGKVTADAYVQLSTAAGAGASGDVRISAGADVKTVDDNGNALMVSATGKGASGDVVVDGNVSAKGMVYIKAGYGDDSSGNVSANGNVTAGTELDVYTRSGGIDVGGSLAAQTGLRILTDNGDLSVHKGADIGLSGADKTMFIGAATVEGGKGSVRIEGSVHADGKNGVVQVQTGMDGVGGTSGDIAINGTIAVPGDNGKVFVTAGYADGSRGNVSIGGSIVAENYIQVHTENGDIKVSKDANMAATGEEGGVRLASAIGEGGAGDVVVKGSLSATDEKGRVTLVSGRGDNSKGDIKVSGDVSAGDTVLVYASYGANAKGGVTLGGNVKGKDLYVATGDGKISFGKGSRLDAVVEQGSVRVYAGVHEGASGGVVADGKINADKYASIITADGNVKLGGSIAVSGKDGNLIVKAGDAGTGNVTLSGEASASDRLLLWADAGDVTIAKGARAETTGADGTLQLVAANREDSTGAINAKGTVSASGKGGIVTMLAGSGAKSEGRVSVKGTVNGHEILIASGRGEGAKGRIDIAGRLDGNANVRVRTGDGDVNVGGTVNVSAPKGDLEIVAGTAEGSTGNVKIDGALNVSGADGYALVMGGYGAKSRGDVTVNGTVKVTGADGTTTLVAGYGKGGNGEVTVNGTVAAGSTANVRTGNGRVAVNGSVKAGGTVTVWADGATAGDITFGGSGALAADTVNVVAAGDVTQSGGTIGSAGLGTLSSVSLSPVIAANRVNIKVDGNVGSGDGVALSVKGQVFGVVSGDARIAAAEGGNFQGGTEGTAPTMAQISSAEQTVKGVTFEQKTIKAETGGNVDIKGVNVEDFNVNGLTVSGLTSDFDALPGNASLMAGGDLSVYTAGAVEANGLLVSGGDLTVSAKSFGDLSYLQAGGVLTINTVGRASGPVLSYFESVNGVTPRIDNQANAAVVFVDGRLAGGNIQTMNTLGNTEAFPVQTPELKSEQGVFGNPVFVHGGLDVSEPVGIGVIDFLLVDRAKMSYGSDIPDDMDMEVSINGLSPLYSYWFGLMASAR